MANKDLGKVGKHFSSSYQPTNAGRKPSQLKKYLKDNNVSSVDSGLIAKNLLFLSREELGQLAADKNKPILLTGAAAALLKDMIKGTTSTMEWLLNRCFGNSKQSIQIETSIPQITPEDREALLKDLLKKNKNKVKELLNEENNTD